MPATAIRYFCFLIAAAAGALRRTPRQKLRDKLPFFLLVRINSWKSEDTATARNIIGGHIAIRIGVI